MFEILASIEVLSHFKGLFDPSTDDSILDSARVNNARIRLARMAHWNNGDEEVSFDRVEFAVSLDKSQYHLCKWRVQTLTTLITQKTQGIFKSISRL